MKKILPLLLCVLLSGCGNHNNNVDKSEQFLRATSPIYSQEIQPQMDSVFQIIHVLLPSELETHYVYILDASCSACIAGALDCYGVYTQLLSEDGSSEFDFISTIEDVEIFDYYFREQFGDKEPRCRYYADFQIPIGLYTVRQGQLVAYSAWQ
ncbi:MAG: hypothetical protein K6G53_06450 [Bacteroidales bacterium]|nr:hypothetical protein [Bacteroidales bacterium]